MAAGGGSTHASRKPKGMFRPHSTSARTKDWRSRDLRPHQLDLKLAPDSARIAFECGKRWSVFARRFESRDGALGRAHAGCDCVLGETGARASLEHLSRDLILQRQSVVGSAKALSCTSLRKEGLLIVGTGLYFNSAMVYSLFPNP